MSVRIAPPPGTPFQTLNQWLDALYKELIRLDNENRKLQLDVEIARTNRLILPDENGDRYSIRVDSSGPTVTATAL